MGSHGDGNKKKKFSRSVSRHRMKSKRVRKTARGRVGRIQGEISHPELVTTGILKKRMRNPRSNLTLSGKKKRKIIKQLKHMEKEKSQMKVEDTVPVKKKGEPKDIEMAEVKTKTKKQSHRKNQMDFDEET